MADGRYRIVTAREEMVVTVDAGGRLTWRGVTVDCRSVAIGLHRDLVVKRAKG